MDLHRKRVPLSLSTLEEAQFLLLPAKINSRGTLTSHPFHPTHSLPQGDALCSECWVPTFHPPYTVAFFVMTHLGSPALWKPPPPHCYHSDWPSWCDQVWHQTRTPAPCCGGSQGQWHFPGCSGAVCTQSDEATLVGYQFDWQREAQALALRIYRKTALEYLTGSCLPFPLHQVPEQNFVVLAAEINPQVQNTSESCFYILYTQL